MVRKKVFIAMDTMLCGGIEKSILSLLYALSPEKMDESTACRYAGRVISEVL